MDFRRAASTNFKKQRNDEMVRISRKQLVEFKGVSPRQFAKLFILAQRNPKIALERYLVGFSEASGRQMEEIFRVHKKQPRTSVIVREENCVALSQSRRWYTFVNFHPDSFMRSAGFNRAKSRDSWGFQITSS